MCKPIVIAISGVKNSGKTTFLENILPLLRQKGLRVGVIKHDGHDFVPDVPETDSYRLRTAGAQTVAVYSASRWLLTCESAISLEVFLEQMSDLDLILLEGQKNSHWPKIELVRSAVSCQSVCNPETLLALVTDLDLAATVPGVPIVSLGNYSQAVQLLLSYIAHPYKI